MRILSVWLLVSAPPAAAMNLFNLAPPSPVTVLASTVAELVLRARLREVQKVEVHVDSSPAGLLAGRVDGVSVSGRGWCTPMRLSCRSVQLNVGTTALDIPALLSSRRIVLQSPATGTATICFSPADWDNFLRHPLLLASLKQRRTAAPAPEVLFRPGARVLPPPFNEHAGGIQFPVEWDGQPLIARLSQRRTDGQVVVETRASGRRLDPSDASDVADASEWLKSFFETLVVDLDGCALTFRGMRTVRSAELSLDLDVCVRSFPSLDVNF